MKSPVRLGFLLAALLMARPGLRADAPPADPIPSLTLRDGRVLHNVKVMSTEEDSVVVHADEGLIKVMRSNLPASLAAPLPDKPADPSSGPGMVMQTFNPNEAPAKEKEAKPAPKVSPPPKVPAAPKEVNAVFKGCSIVSFQKKAFQNVLGCAEVVVRNDSDVNVILVPRDVACVLSDGKRRAGRFFVTDGFPPQVKRREMVPAGGQIDDLVTFTYDDQGMASVQWTR